MLYRLLQATNRELYEVDVICLTEMDVYGELLQQHHINVYSCNLKTDFLKAIWQCFRLCKQSDIIQTWMYHSNFIGFLIAKTWRKKIIWGIHHSNLEKHSNKRTTIWIAKLCASFSRYVDGIVSCGPQVKAIHEAIGYTNNQHHVIVNGIETDLFRPSVKRVYYQTHFAIEDKPIILHVGRWDPLKDYPNLLASMRLLQQRGQDFYLFLVGLDIDEANQQLLALIRQEKLSDYVWLLGCREDIPQLMAAADVLVLSSAGEGLPNVLVEALASGTCCVTTDVGDCRYIVGDYGEVVSAKDATALAQAIAMVLHYNEQQYETKARLGREHVIAHFHLPYIAEQYQALYEQVCICEPSK
ncbi:glycosyl transferase [Lysinibacillus piscis]|uniref:Glycosyl transferase n=2 Tax=Lysinibacillus piscis TaxID=2518931 RepID=A0ABQ5NG78_9BACI|nr:glycosyl transferase [Lysinibacillus sp. KH24]